MASKPARYELVDAVLLSIDSATISGISIAIPDKDEDDNIVNYETVRLGTVTTQAERQEIVELAVETAGDLELPLIVIAEEWTRHGISTVAFVSLCENWGKWLAELEQAEVPKEHVVRAKPDTWRNPLFGRKRPKKRESNKKLACSYIVNVLHLAPHGHDVAEAVYLRAWGCRAEAVHAIVDKLKEAA